MQIDKKDPAQALTEVDLLLVRAQSRRKETGRLLRWLNADDIANLAPPRKRRRGLQLDSAEQTHHHRSARMTHSAGAGHLGAAAEATSKGRNAHVGA